MLTPTQLADQRRLGYAIDPRFFSTGEVALMRAELDRLMAAGEVRNVATQATAGAGATAAGPAMNLQICPLSPRSPTLRALPFAKKLVTQAHAILGTDLFLRLDQIFIKPARHGTGTSWHQDNAYFRDCADALCHRGLGMWIALHDASLANGTMHVIPRAFAATGAHQRDPGSDHHIHLATRPDEALAVPIEIPAGGVLFFNYGVPHCTKANTTDAARAGLAIHVQDLALRTAELAADGWPHPILCGPGADGGLEIYGEDQRGQWESMVG